MPSVDRLTARLDAENYTAVVADHEIDICIARTRDGIVHEIAFGGRGKIGQGMDTMLTDLGIALSRAIQQRDPTTGEA